MLIVDLKRIAGRQVERFGSTGASVAHLIPGREPISAVVIRIEAGGVLGHHPAATNQLFCVVQGEGWVRGEEEERTPVRAGQAAFWTRGEGHESGSQGGMTALVLEGDALDPRRFTGK